jgi:hypothetical protein
MTDINGIQWKNDQYFNGGTAHASLPGALNISNPVYRTMRATDFGYDIPAPEGEYQVFLHFVEAWTNATNARLFNITIQNVLAFPNFDINRVSGGAYRLARIRRDVTVLEGENFISMNIKNVRGNAYVSGIEIQPIRRTAAPTMLATRYPTRAPTVTMPKQCTIPKVCLL